MKPFPILIVLGIVASFTGPGLLRVAGADPAAEPEPSWQKALPGWDRQFPRDHFSHPEFRTEWWYATGQVSATDGQRFGYQLTLFRRGIRPPAARPPVTSAWVMNDLPLAHFAVTDVRAGKFFFDQKLERGAFGRAEFPLFQTNQSYPATLARVGDWSMSLEANGDLNLEAAQNGAQLQLRLQPASAPVWNGDHGISQKAAGAGNASVYYSMPGMRTSGTVTTAGGTHEVTGLSWLDREWATNQLAADQTGWDWFALHLADGSRLMLYQLRRRDASADPWSSGTWIAPDGTSRSLRAADFRLTPVPGRLWTSPRTSAVYPIAWKIEFPQESLVLVTKPLLENQELALDPVSYWEGGIVVEGTRHGQALQGEGYLEMTGYSGPLHALKQ